MNGRRLHGSALCSLPLLASAGTTIHSLTPLLGATSGLLLLAVLFGLTGGAGTLAAAPAQAAHAPLKGRAWQLGDAAFKAYNRKNYAKAAALAERALALRPDVTRLWLLRIYALQNLGKLHDALQTAERALALGRRDSALTAAHDSLRSSLGAGVGAGAAAAQSPAWKFGDTAYKDYSAGRYAEAEENARRSLRLQPANPGLQALLVYALEKQGKDAEAAKEADAALALAHQDETLQALRDRMHRRLAPVPAAAAWQAYRDGQYGQAATLAQQAVHEAPDVPSYHYLVIGALLNGGQYAEADAAATAALEQDGDDPMALSLRGYARQRLGRDDQARADLEHAQAQDWLSEQQLATVKRIAADTLRPVPAGAPMVFCTADPQDVLCSLMPAGSSLSGASPGYDAAVEAYASQAQGDYAQAARHAGEAVAAAPDNLAYRLLQINALALNGQRTEARQAFAPLAQAQHLPPENLLDGAYAAQRLADNAQASAWFSQAVDAADAGRIELSPQARHNVREAVSDLDRTWGARVAFGYGTVGVINPLFAPSPSARKTLQASEELYWRPPLIGLRDGSTFEVYGRLNQALYDGTGGATGLSTNQGVLGMRWKPFGRQNLVLAAERFFRVGDHSRDDWLLRAAWSAGEGGGLRVDHPHWTYWQVYAEGDYFVSHPQTLGTLEGRYGRAFRIDHISSNLVVAPYAAVNGGYDSLLATRATAGAGPGVTLRWWFREDTHHAPQSFVELNVQYRVRIAGDDRSEGLFAGFYFSY